MDLAWRLLKRQTELGEFHEDFPSSHGPVTEYHGTLNLPGVLSQRGIDPPRRRRSKRHYPEEMRADPPEQVTYTSPDRQAVQEFLRRRLEQTGIDPAQAGVIGVRGAGLPEAAEQMEEGYGGAPMSTFVRPGGIPRERLTVVKHATSPEALRHKVAYDTKYQSTPERVDYREELKTARRRAHVYGKGGKDMSHTKEGTIVPEDPHTNRARHFKERGTLK